MGPNRQDHGRRPCVDRVEEQRFMASDVVRDQPDDEPDDRPSLNTPDSESPLIWAPPTHAGPRRTARQRSSDRALPGLGHCCSGLEREANVVVRRRKTGSRTHLPSGIAAVTGGAAGCSAYSERADDAQHLRPTSFDCFVPLDGDTAGLRGNPSHSRARAAQRAQSGPGRADLWGPALRLAASTACC